MITTKRKQRLLIESIGYDLPTNTLEIEFSDKAVYQYFDVPKHMYKQLMAEKRKYKFFEKSIRSQYAFARVDDEK